MDSNQTIEAELEYLDEGDVLFPNAIILALDSDTQFKQARGTKPEGDESVADAGTLLIPYGKDENKKAWVVDGQQRTLALSRTKNSNIPLVVFQPIIKILFSMINKNFINILY